MKNQVRGLGGNLECVADCVAIVLRTELMIDVVLVAILSVRLDHSLPKKPDYSTRNLFFRY